MNTVEHLRALEARAAPLQADAATRQQRQSRAASHAEQFLEGLPELPVYGPASERAAALAAMAIDSEGAGLDDALSVLQHFVDGQGHNLGSSRFFGYIPSGALFEAALADYLAAISNRYSGVGPAAPGVSRMDQTLLSWLASVVGYPTSAEGDLTSGGSMATLSAIVVAREARGLRSADFAKAVVYLTAQTHHTFAKALRIAGLGDALVRTIAVDSGQRMNARALAQQVQEDLAQGLQPWLIAASAGTTDVGAIDPLPQLAEIAEQHHVWLHVDAAYGGAFALCDEGQRRLTGIAQADSLVLDPHKGFFLPCGSGVLLVRDGQRLYDAYHARGSYMQDFTEDSDRSACDFSPELTRPFRALRLWLPLKVHGTAPFTAALEEKLLLAQYFYEQLAQLPNMEVSPPDLSIVPFRYAPTSVASSGDIDALNRQLLDAINASDQVFLSSTSIDGVFTLRMAILNYQTHLPDVELTLSIIRQCVAELAPSR